MAEYSPRVYRLHKRFPEQFVLYVGNRDMTMSSALEGPNHICRYTIIDIRGFDADILLKSPFATDNILAILASQRDRPETIRRILRRIAKLEVGARDAAFSKLMILAGLRKLGDSIRSEVKQMPILDDIMDHDVIGPAIREGRLQGELAVLRRLIAKRFGSVPSAVDERLLKLPIAELEDFSDKIIDAKTIDELF